MTSQKVYITKYLKVYERTKQDKGLGLPVPGQYSGLHAIIFNDEDTKAKGIGEGCDSSKLQSQRLSWFLLVWKESIHGWLYTVKLILFVLFLVLVFSFANNFRLIGR